MKNPQIGFLPALCLATAGVTLHADALVTVADFGATTPVIEAVDTGYTGTAGSEYSFDGTDTWGQSFKVPTTGVVQKVYLQYTRFGNADTDGLIDFTFKLDVNNDGVFEINQAFTGVNRASFTTANTLAWLEFDLSSANIVLPAGTTHSVYVISNEPVGQWVCAPRYNSANVYADGAELGAAASGDMAFAVKMSVPDTDGDGITDLYEQANTNPTSATALVPGLDDDTDGLSNLQEFLGQDAIGTVHGFGQTRAILADSDSDGLKDGQETGGLLNPFRVDHIAGNPAEGVPGRATNPNLADSDGDGLNDGQEANGRNSSGVSHGFGATNPHTNDTDGDSLPDVWEINNTLSPNDDGLVNPDYGTYGDPDSDNVDNFTEFSLGTNPRNADSDNDGYTDAVEDRSGSWFGTDFTGTNPLKADTDGDGLPDGKENPDLLANNPPSQYKTNPNIFDTDGDFYGDGDEVTAGTNPADNTSVPTGIAVRDIKFSSTSGGWTNAGATTLETTTPLLTGSGQYARISGATMGGGVLVKYPNPTVPTVVSSTAHCSMNFRAEGTLDGTGAFNITSGAKAGITTDQSVHCIVRLNGDGSVTAYDGTNFLQVVAPGGIVVGTTYTIQIDHHIIATTYDVRIINTATSGVVGSLTSVPTRPTSNPSADPLYFAAGNQSANSAWSVAVDNMAVTFNAAVTTPDNLKVTHVGFNGTAFEITVSGFNTSRMYILKRSPDLSAAFSPIGSAFTPAATTQIVSDPSPIGSKAFYRIESAP
ncbi:MAG: hypothetical protein ABIT37_17620 [Luteolibacter sp.]